MLGFLKHILQKQQEKSVRDPRWGRKGVNQSLAVDMIVYLERSKSIIVGVFLLFVFIISGVVHCLV